MARTQHHHFTKTVLPQQFFAAPGETVTSLLSPDATSFLFHHWSSAADANEAPPSGQGLDVLGISQAGAQQVVFIAMPPLKRRTRRSSSRWS